MPRVKIRPVKRSSHKFENDIVCDVFPDLRVNAIDNAGTISGQKQRTNTRSSKNMNASLKISKISSVSNDWMKIGRKIYYPQNWLDKQCSILQLSIGDSKLKFETDSCEHVEVLTTCICRELKQLICSEIIELVADCTEADTNDTLAKIELKIYISKQYLTALKISLSPQLIAWIVGHHVSPSLPCWAEKVEVEFNFSEFIQKSSTSSITQIVSISYDSPTLLSLENALVSYGLKTSLKLYQLQGVYWMFQKLMESDTTSVQSSASGFNRWLYIPVIDDSSATTSASILFFPHRPNSSQLNIATDSCLRYCILTGVLDLGNPIQYNHYSAKSLLLADEMGMGKSVQILALILLLKYSNNVIPVTIDRAPISSSKVVYDSSVDTIGCLCGRTDCNRKDICWIQCSYCPRWSHAACYGFKSSLEAQSTQSHSCLPCSCRYHYALNKKIRSDCTIILLPNTLISQWVGEINKHIKDHSATCLNPSDISVSSSAPPVNTQKNKKLRVYIYEGTNYDLLKKNGQSYAHVSPTNLASNDIILMSLKILQKDFHVTKSTTGQALLEKRDTRYSNHKRKQFTATQDNESYEAIATCNESLYFPPPILGISFKLLVIDETQKIESEKVSQVLYMADSISSEYRISVSGTPLGNESVNDLRSLSQFLRLKPFDNADRSAQSPWERVFGDNSICVNKQVKFDWLAQLFDGIILRRTKAMVAEQLNLKEQVTFVTPLTFSDFEMALYTEKSRPIVDEISSIMPMQDYENNSAEGTLQNLNKHLTQANADGLSIAQIKFEVLRKGCCHPQILDPTLGGGNRTSTSARSFHEIIALKVDHARLATESKLRDLLAHVFKLAGIHLLQVEVLQTEHAKTGSVLGCRPDNHSLHYKRALTAYMWAWQLIEVNRSKPCPLLAIAKATQNTKILLCNSLNVSTTCETKDVVIDVPILDSSRIPMCWQVDLKGDCTSCYAPNRETIDLQYPGLYYQLVFPNKRTILGAKVTNLIKKSRILEVIGTHLSKCLSSNNAEPSSSNNFLKLLKDSMVDFKETSTSTTCDFQLTKGDQIVGVLMFPAEISLQTLNGNDHAMMNTCIGKVPLENGLDEVVVETSGNSRSRQWQLSVHSLHLKGLALICSNTSSQSYQLQWVNLIAAFNTCSNLTAFAVMEIELTESVLDVDIFQELHACRNLIHVEQQLNLGAQVGTNGKGISLHRLSKEVGRSRVRTLGSFKTSNAVVDFASQPEVAVNLMVELSENITEVESIGEMASESSAHNSTFLQRIISRASQIEQDYLQAAILRNTSAFWKLRQVHQEADCLEKDLNIKCREIDGIKREWWVLLLPHLERDSSSLGALYTQIDLGGDAYSRLRNFRDMNGLAFIVGSEFSKLVENRKKAVQAVCGIPDKPSEADILEGSNCSRCRDYFMKSGPVCKHCKIKDVITAYEKVLFSSRKSHKNMIRNTSEATSKFKSAKKSKRNSQKAEASSPASQNGNFFSCKNGDSNYGSGSENDEFALREVEVDRVDGPYIMLTKHLKRFASKVGLNNVAAIGGLELNWLSLLEKELKGMQDAWIRHLELLKVHDELEMASSRVQLAPSATTSIDPNSENMESQFIHAFELTDSYQMTFNNAIVAEADLQTSLSTLLFYKEQEKKIKVGNGSSNTSRLEDALSTPIQVVPLQQITKPRSDFEKIIEEDTEENCCIICRDPLFGKKQSEAENLSVVQNLSTNPSSRNNNRHITTEAAPVILPCAHMFHRGCIEIWLKSHSKCVICKGKAVKSDLLEISRSLELPKPNIPSLNVLTPKGSSGLGVSTSSVMDSAVMLDVSKYRQWNPDGSQKFSTKVGVAKGQWGTKIDALVRDLLSMLASSECEGEKAIVFSQWIEMIEIVSEALEANKIKFSLCKDRSRDFGSKGPLESFKCDPDVRVLLLPLYLGAEGLDLIEASHVFILEPLLNRALEVQAVNRVHRIGQTRQTKVHKYVVLGTVEQSIHEATFDSALLIVPEASSTALRTMITSSVSPSPTRPATMTTIGRQSSPSTPVYNPSQTPPSKPAEHRQHSQHTIRRSKDKGDLHAIDFNAIKHLLKRNC